MTKRRELARKDPARRRQAVLDAGLRMFASNGFAATKLDDVAKEAGVAKGTIYLHFRDKQDLFEQIVREAVSPVIGRLEQVAQQPDAPAAELFKAMFEVFRTEVLGTTRKDVLRLVLTEGGRFPAIAAFYHREVISRGLPVIRALLVRAGARGELPAEAVADFPQLVIAPLLMAVIWDGLFEPIEALDVEGLFAAHLELLVGSREGQEPS